MANLFFETYGCQMNIAESDSLHEHARLRGHDICTQAEDADVIIINTCSVRLTAESHVIGRLGYYRALNKDTPERSVHVLLMGCMSENIGQEVKEKFSDIVSILWGTYNKEHIFDYLEDLTLQTESLGFSTDYNFMPSVISKEYPFKAFLPISHGCNKCCTYCIVPRVRGFEKNRNFQEVVDNAKQLVEEGVIELCLLGQTIDTYKSNNKRFPDLLEALAKETEVQRITFLTSHPREFLYDTISLMNEYQNIMPYLHLPYQSGNNRILQLMKRGYSREQYLEKITEIRAIKPDIILSTDIIVGFPSETENEFLETLSLLEKIQFNEAFMYRYNKRPNTPASDFEDQIPEEEKLQRLDLLVKTQRKIMASLLKKQVGTTTKALFDRESKYSKKRNNSSKTKQYLGRTHNNISCVLESENNMIGNIVDVYADTTINSVLHVQSIGKTAL